MMSYCYSFWSEYAKNILSKFRSHNVAYFIPASMCWSTWTWWRQISVTNRSNVYLYLYIKLKPIRWQAHSIKTIKCPFVCFSGNVINIFCFWGVGHCVDNHTLQPQIIWGPSQYQVICHHITKSWNCNIGCLNPYFVWNWAYRYSDVIMTMMVSQITSLTIVYSTVYSGADQRKHQSSVSLAFVWGIPRRLLNSPCTNGQ